MNACVSPGCQGAALASWWRLCLDCSTPALAFGAIDGPASVDQLASAGFDAVTWAERISPAHWGHVREGERWVESQRCLARAAVVTGRTSGCVHTDMRDATVPVVVVPRAVGVLRCASCAEPVVGQTSVGGACDRCRMMTGPLSRAAILTGAALIVVGQLCDGCMDAVLEPLPVIDLPSATA